MRNAELKRLESRTTLDSTTQTSVRAADYPDLAVADGDTVTRVSWIFNGGAFDGQPVFGTLRTYLRKTADLLDQADQRLTP